MLSIEKSKKFLNENDEQFTDEEIIQIRDYFYNLTNITDKFQLEFDEEMNNKEVFINYPFDYIEEESVLFLK